MLTLIFWLFFVPLILVLFTWIASLFLNFVRPTKPGTPGRPKTREDEDLEFVTKMITFDFFFFDW